MRPHSKIFTELYLNATDSLQRKLPLDSLSSLFIQSAHSSYFPLWCVAFQNYIKKPLLIVSPFDEHAIELANDITAWNYTLHPNKTESIVPSFPSWGTIMGRPLSSYAESRYTRAKMLYIMAEQKNTTSIATCSIRSWYTLLPPSDIIYKRSISLNVGDEWQSDVLAELISSYNFLRVPQISGIGEFSIRGEMCDIAMYNSVYRIHFDFDHIEKITQIGTIIRNNITYDFQKETSPLSTITIHPLTEHIWDTYSSIDTLKSRLPDIPSSIIEKTQTHIKTHSFDEYDYMYYPFLYKTFSHITKYFSDAPIVLMCNFEDLKKQDTRYKEEYIKAFLDESHIKCIPRPERMWELCDTISQKAIQIPVLHKEIYDNTDNKNHHHIIVGDKKVSGFNGNIRYFEKYVEKRIQDNNEHYAIFAPSTQQKERIETLCNESLLKNNMFSIEILDIHSGFSIHTKSGSFTVYNESNILGKKLFSSLDEKIEDITNIDAIEENTIVVHIHHGIGIFRGLKRVPIHGSEKDFMHIEYADGESLYVPIEQITMVQRYIGKEKNKVRLDTIGGGTWKKKKNKVLKHVEDLSKDLLEIQAERNNLIGFAYSKETEWEKKFIQNFQFTETNDQIHAWKEIASDMESAQVMDRLVVGDVGFGKTELAMRAIFKAIVSGKQALFLVPTTILAEQHYNVTLTRFEDFPVKIGILSRLIDKKTQKNTIELLKTGEIDLLIGTHRGIQNDISFYDLGLIIIDEEHKFGVKDKERIKHLKRSVDCLALSATPIPRTLYQSLVNIRSISTLTTPPKIRKPIKTFVEKYDEKIIQSAIIKELDRKGQVFFLHNRVQSLEEIKEYITRLVPRATVLTASGKMPPAQLENTMHRFIHGGANVLVSTTIIENGIDIPSVNTIIIDRADMYGVSQLYQLRGRVGRSDKTAYAYLLYPDENRISEIALRRLTTISDHSELGSGFHIAMQDLEIRGAGNLLGKEQSGGIYSIGYEYYLQLLDKAIKKASGIKIQDSNPLIEIEYRGYIPNKYIPDMGIKMSIYKKILRIRSIEEYKQVKEYLTNTFGPIPNEIYTLMHIAKIKILMGMLCIQKLSTKKDIFELYFSSNTQKENIQTKISLLIKRKIFQFHKKYSHILIFEYKSFDTALKSLEEHLLYILKE